MIILSLLKIPIESIVCKDSQTYIINCIEEETLNLGLGDEVELRETATSSSSSSSSHVPVMIATVIQVNTMKSCTIQLTDSVKRYLEGRKDLCLRKVSVANRAIIIVIHFADSFLIKTNRGRVLRSCLINHFMTS